jgi:hypothetical protein
MRNRRRACCGRFRLTAGYRKFCLDELKAFGDKGIKPAASNGAMLDGPAAEYKAAAELACCPIYLCRFNPGFWNTDPYIRQNNNCYNYACNRGSYTNFCGYMYVGKTVVIR